jgi:CheY-like chemotaxis protein
MARASIRPARAAGFDHHLTKPLNPDRLAELFDANDPDR